MCVVGAGTGVGGWVEAEAGAVGAGGLVGGCWWSAGSMDARLVGWVVVKV